MSSASFDSGDRHGWVGDQIRRLSSLTHSSQSSSWHDERSPEGEAPLAVVENQDGQPPAEPISRLIDELSRLWFDGRIFSDKNAPPVHDETFHGTEALITFAKARNIEVQFEKRAVSNLQKVDLPAILLTKDGLGRLLMERRDNVFIARTQGRYYPLMLDELEKEGVDVVFLLQPRSILARLSFSAADGAEPAAATQQPTQTPSEKNKPDAFWAILGHIVTYQRPLMVQLLIAAAFSNMTLLALPIYSNIVFDRVIPHSAFDTLWALSLGVFIALFADICVRWGRLKIQDALSCQVSASLQARMVSDLIHVKMIEAPRSTGAVIGRLGEIDSLTQLVPQVVVGMLVDMPFLLIVFLLLWLNGGIVFVVPILGMIVLLALNHIAKIAAHGEQSKAVKLQHIQTNSIVEAVQGLENLKSTRTERKVLGKFEALYDEFAYAAHKARLSHSIVSYANGVLGQMMIVLVTILGVYQIAAGTMSIGSLTACTLLVGRVIAPMGQFAAVLYKLQETRRMLASLARDSFGTSEIAGDTSGALHTPMACSFRFHHVNFTYPSQQTPQLRDINLEIKPGEKVALVGLSGSGKSTLLKMFSRLLDPNEGNFLVDTVDARQYSPQNLRASIGHMGQSPFLVDDTLLVNLTLGCPPIDPDYFATIARITGVVDFAARHPQGYAMRVGLHGENLSVGERQSVSLARLLLSSPKVLVLDEPSAAMDSVLEARLVRELPPLLAGKTLIVATHRPSFLALADRVIWLENGVVMADGPKAEILKRMSGG